MTDNLGDIHKLGGWLAYALLTPIGLLLMTCTENLTAITTGALLTTTAALIAWRTHRTPRHCPGHPACEGCRTCRETIPTEAHR